MKPEVSHGATQVNARVQGGGGEADPGTWDDGGISHASCVRAWYSVAPMGAGVFRRWAAGLSRPWAVDARQGGTHTTPP